MDVYQSADHEDLSAGIVPVAAPAASQAEPEVFRSSDHEALQGLPSMGTLPIQTKQITPEDPEPAEGSGVTVETA